MSTTNPKDLVGERKARWFSYLPLRVLVGVGLAMFEGARKYGAHNWRVYGVKASVYVDATVCGHLMLWFEGQEVDENGNNHLDLAIAGLLVLRDSQLQGNMIDDRPISAANMDMPAAHAKAAALADKFPAPVARFTQV